LSPIWLTNRGGTGEAQSHLTVWTLTVGQDYSALGQYVDIVSLMVYHLMCGHGPAWISQVVTEIRALSGNPVWPIIQSVDMPALLPAAEYEQALEIALSSPASNGVLVFTMQGALDPDKLARTIAWFAARDQGC
jgi:hypothetical protein